MPNDYHFFQDKIAGKQDQIYDYSPFINEFGDFASISGINVIIQSLRTLLMTPLGHYPFDPEYGSLLYKQLFEMSDSITSTIIKNEVSTRAMRYDSRIKIIDVSVVYSNDKKTVIVNVIIDRNGLRGKVEAVLSAQNTMFGIEDTITASAGA